MAKKKDGAAGGGGGRGAGRDRAGDRMPAPNAGTAERVVYDQLTDEELELRDQAYATMAMFDDMVEEGEMEPGEEFDRLADTPFTVGGRTMHVDVLYTAINRVMPDASFDTKEEAFMYLVSG